MCDWEIFGRLELEPKNYGRLELELELEIGKAMCDWEIVVRLGNLGRRRAGGVWEGKVNMKNK